VPEGSALSDWAVEEGEGERVGAPFPVCVGLLAVLPAAVADLEAAAADAEEREAAAATEAEEAAAADDEAAAEDDEAAASEAAKVLAASTSKLFVF
jgi:hypothetical protein